MALPTINISEFVGTLRLTQDAYAATEFQEIINERLPEILRCYIGQSAFDYVESEDVLPNEWVKFFDGGSYTDNNSIVQYCYGFNNAVKHLLYFELLRSTSFTNTATGNVSNLNENSVAQTRGDMSAFALNKYNTGIYRMQTVYAFVGNTDYFEENFPNMPLPKLEMASI